MLAIKGGDPSVTLPFPEHPVVGKEEREAVDRVFDRNQFSQFIASAGKAFLGGEEVQAFEQEVAAKAGCKYGVAYNSWTSGLHAAVASAHKYNQPLGSVVLTTPYTFTSSATCALMNNQIPGFVDVDPQTCNITAETLEQALKRFSPVPKTLVLVHLFGLPADIDSILEVCNKHDIAVIEDAAQAPGAEYKESPIGSMGLMGGFSFTQSKAVMSGEGGILVTNNDRVVKAARMVRNHGEAVTDGDRTYNAEVLGMGYRMTELAAAIGRAQWSKLDHVNNIRIDLNERFKTRIGDMCDFISFQKVGKDMRHVYYTTTMFFDSKRAGVHRDVFCDALIAEGVPIFKGYVKPLYLQTLYQSRQHTALSFAKPKYEKGSCPTAEKLWKDDLFFMMCLRPPMGDDLFEQIISAYKKVIDNIGSL